MSRWALATTTRPVLCLASPQPYNWLTFTRTRHSRCLAEVDRKDYRAWYGLGQAYELLGEPFYALNYYNRATALRPYDARMWSALATCYEKLKR